MMERFINSFVNRASFIFLVYVLNFLSVSIINQLDDTNSICMATAFWYLHDG